MTGNKTRNTGMVPTTAQLKEAIDRGEAADKVDFPDPAASPLGTDAEAGGSAPTPQELAIAFKHEIAGHQELEPQRRTLLAVAGFAAIITIAVLLSVLVMVSF